MYRLKGRFLTEIRRSIEGEMGQFGKPAGADLGGGCRGCAPPPPPPPPRDYLPFSNKTGILQKKKKKKKN